MFTTKIGRFLQLNARNGKRVVLNSRRRPLELPKTGCLRPTVFLRSFTASSHICIAEVDATDANTRPDESTTESDKWISILENTTSAKWAFTSISGAEPKMMLAYTLLFQIVLYLSRPDGGEQFLTAFGTAPASPKSEIGRARVAVPVILRAAVSHLSSVPLNSSVRSEHSDVFDIFGALQAINDMYLVGGIPDLQTWTTFWSRAQPVVIELCMKLDEKGFGLPTDDSGGDKKPSV